MKADVIDLFGARPQPKRARDAVFEALARVCGLDLSQMPRSERGRLNRATRDLKEIEATPEQIEHKAQLYRERWPTIELTPTALVSNWCQIEATQKPRVDYNHLEDADLLQEAAKRNISTHGKTRYELIRMLTNG